MKSRLEAMNDARRLLHAHADGVLATQSADMPGYPFSSVMPFCLDREGMPIILVANIAQHTHNMQHDGKVSLIVFERGADDLQTAGRLTLLANATPLADSEQDTRERYYRYFPETREYHAMHDFAFWRLTPQRLRYIGGFGVIRWFEPDDVLTLNPIHHDDELRMVRHMNDDHVGAMRHYCERAAVASPAGIQPSMAGIDTLGFHLRLGAKLVRFHFRKSIVTPGEVREQLVALARPEAAAVAS
jgi:heme iron utilization protein